MAEVDDWAPVTPKKAADDDWAPVGAPAQNVAITPGEKQFEEDKRIVEQAAGLAPGELKAATYSALKSFLLGAPTHVVAAYTAYKEGKPYEETFKEQQRYEQALERQYPTSSTVGTGLGIGAGFLVPMGAVGQAGRALKAGTAAKLAETAAPQIVKKAVPAAAELLPSAGVAGAMTGVSSALERPVTDIDVGGALKDAAIGAGVGAAAQAALPALGRYFSKFPDPVDVTTGKLKPEAEAAVQRAFGNRMSADDIESFKDQLIDKFRSKGISEQAAKEALLAKEGVTPTRTMVTGERPKPAAADIAEKAGVQAEDILGQKAAAMAGEAPATSAAEALHGAYRGEIGQYKSLREDISGRRGTFGADTFDLFLPNIEKSLAREKIPTSFESTGDLFPKAAQAKKFIEEGIAAGNLPNPNAPFNMDNLELVRRGLVQYSKDARSPTDRRAIGVMIDGFDNALNQAISKNLFTGNGRQLIADMKDSRDLWSTIQKKYFDDKGEGGKQFKKLMNELVDRKTSSIPQDLTKGSADAANFIVNTGLLNPKYGTAMYERMETALGADSAAMKTVKDQIRNMVLNTNGDLKKLPDSINKFLSQSPDVAKKVFDGPNELSDLRRLSESIRLISTSRLPNEQKESKIIGAIQRLGTMVGAIAAWNFHSPVAGALTYLGGEGGRAAIGAGREMLQRAAERGAASKTSAKAPEVLRRLETAPEMNVPVRNVQPLLEPSTEEFQYQEPTPLGGRPGRKSGGRVGKLSDRLVTAVDRAKKDINNDTKVLLNADDNHVAKALEVANRHLEG